MVFHNMEIGVTIFVSTITQELPVPDQKAQYMVPHTLLWDRWMDNSDTQDGALKQNETESLTGTQKEKGKPFSR